ncbi:DMT family transporter [Salipiger pacificus]|nr:DMT family transporter [Alloyangia pacifica]
MSIIFEPAVREDRAIMAVAVMIATNATLAVADVIIKVTLSEMPLAQFIFLRSCITLPVLVVLMRTCLPGRPVRPAHLGWAALRSVLLLSSLLLYYASLPRLAFSLAAATYYTIPLFVTLLSAILIRDHIGAKGWLAVGLGFIGVLLMLKPDVNDLNLAVLLPLGSAFLYAVGMVLTRTRNRSENPLALAFVFNCIAVLAGGAVGIAGLVLPAQGGALPVVPWLSLSEISWPLIVLLSLTMLIGSVGTAFAYQAGPPSLVSTWDFTYLAFAVLLGVTVFSEHLDMISVLGVTLIPLAGMIVLRR